MVRHTLFLASCLFFWGAVTEAATLVVVTKVQGTVTARAPRGKAYAKVAVDDALANGARIRTGGDGQATLRYFDGTEVRIRPKSEMIVRSAEASKDTPSGVVLFFGRVWAQVVKRVGGASRFEVESANAVAGVRGTVLEVGVADDGATRVLVSEGEVVVTGDTGGETQINAGYEVESDGGGRLARRRRAASRPDWDGWFAKRAKKLEKRGLEVARDLKDRLNRRRGKLRRLVGQQRRLRRQIQHLEAKQRAGADVRTELEDRLDRLNRVTERLLDMRNRLQAGFGMFERWGRLAESGVGGRRLGRMAGDMAAIARDFADLFEEGTDLSKEGMEEMMEEMKKGSTLDPRRAKDGKNAADELF